MKIPYKPASVMGYQHWRPAPPLCPNSGLDPGKRLPSHWWYQADTQHWSTIGFWITRFSESTRINPDISFMKFMTETTIQWSLFGLKRDSKLLMPIQILSEVPIIFPCLLLPGTEHYDQGQWLPQARGWIVVTMMGRVLCQSQMTGR